MSGLLDLPLATPVAALLKRANEWWFCDGCGYVSRSYPWRIGVHHTDHYDEVFPPCPCCTERLWKSVSGLDREERWAFVCSEIPNAVIDALAEARS